MMQTLKVWVGAAIIYLYGTVNGDEATFTLIGGGYWQAEVPRSEDQSYVVHLEAYSSGGLEGTYDYTLYYGMWPMITDRTLSDVNRARTLRDKGWSAMTGPERAEWLAGLKGAYNAEDLNRVGSVTAYLAAELGLYGYTVPVAPKTDWTSADVPTAPDMDIYLGDVQAVKDKFYGQTPLPGAMDGLTFEGANNIEKLLLEIEENIRRMKAGFRKSGTFKSGQGVILP